MTGYRPPCGHPTLASTRCRRPGQWGLPNTTDVLCHQHATDVARNRGVGELIHWITGERREVAAGIATAAAGAAVLPTGRDAILRALNRVRTRRALARARLALITDYRACAEGGALAHDVLTSLRAAHARVGLPMGGST